MASPFSASKPVQEDCISCRITGTLAMAGLGSYALYHAQMKTFPKWTPLQLRAVAGGAVADVRNRPSDAKAISLLRRGCLAMASTARRGVACWSEPSNG
jgi:hypothetical protein